MKLSAIVFSTVIVLTGMPLAAYAQAPSAGQAVQAVQVNNKVCPVSGREISANSGMASATYEYKGKVYKLCCAGCINLFKADPEKYSKIADQAVAGK